MLYHQRSNLSPRLSSQLNNTQPALIKQKLHHDLLDYLGANALCGQEAVQCHITPNSRVRFSTKALRLSLDPSETRLTHHFGENHRKPGKRTLKHSLVSSLSRCTLLLGTLLFQTLLKRGTSAKQPNPLQTGIMSGELEIPTYIIYSLCYILCFCFPLIIVITPLILLLILLVFYSREFSFFFFFRLKLNNNFSLILCILHCIF